MELLREGAVYRGVVCSVAPFGVFVELIAGQQEGLLAFDRTPYPEIARQLRTGDVVEVVAIAVDVDREQVRVALLPDATRYDGFWTRRPASAEPGPGAGRAGRHG
jgi:ribosomal protein S1